MPRNTAEVTETEFAILDVLWRSEGCAIREIVESLYGEHTPARHATVKSLLERLEGKGYVECDKSRFAHRFSAKISREAYVGDQLKQLAESHFGGAMAPMLLTLVDRIGMSRKDREAIRKMIDGIK